MLCPRQVDATGPRSLGFGASVLASARRTGAWISSGRICSALRPGAAPDGARAAAAAGAGERHRRAALAGVGERQLGCG